MKILVLHQNSNLALIKQGLDKARSLYPYLEFTYQETAKYFTTEQDTSTRVKPNEILDEAGSGYEIVLLIYDWDKVAKPKPTNPSTSSITRNGCRPIQIPSQWYATFPETLTEFFFHELCHAFYLGSSLKDLTHEKYGVLWNGIWNNKSAVDYYLFLLNQFKPKTTKYRHFSEKEIVGLKPELVGKLDVARDIAGIAFVITSGYRTGSHNAEVGGTEDSSHLSGLAVDIRARNTNEQYLITKGLIMAGFRRISRQYPMHIHCDISKDKPQDVLF